MGRQTSRTSLPESVQRTLPYVVQARTIATTPGLAILLQRDDGIDLSWSNYTKQRYLGDNDNTFLPHVGMLAKSCPKVTFIEDFLRPYQTSRSLTGERNHSYTIHEGAALARSFFQTYEGWSDNAKKYFREHTVQYNQVLEAEKTGSSKSRNSSKIETPEAVSLSLLLSSSKRLNVPFANTV